MLDEAIAKAKKLLDKQLAELEWVWKKRVTLSLPDVRMVVPSHRASANPGGGATAVKVMWCSKQCFVALIPCTASSQSVPIVTCADTRQEPARRTEKQIVSVPGLRLQEGSC